MLPPTQHPVWDERYQIGSEQVDAQHRRLFELLAMLVDAEQGRCDHSIVDHAVNGLYGYIRFHFADEEQLMDELRYPDRERHRRLHDQFILNYDDLVSRYQSAPDFLQRLIAFVQSWLINHIMTEDARIHSGV